jgi:hypothetical protein
MPTAMVNCNVLRVLQALLRAVRHPDSQPLWRACQSPVQMRLSSARPIAFGCMRLSTEPDRVWERSLRVVHAALDAGVTFRDTADAYACTNDDIGHDEQLIAHGSGPGFWPVGHHPNSHASPSPNLRTVNEDAIA